MCKIWTEFLVLPCLPPGSQPFSVPGQVQAPVVLSAALYWEKRIKKQSIPHVVNVQAALLWRLSLYSVRGIYVTWLVNDW